MRGLTINDAGKLIVVLVALVGGVVMAIVGALVHDATGLATAGVGLSTGALGYTFGNGRLASRVEAPATMMSPVLAEHPNWVAKDQLRQLAVEQKRTDAAARAAKPAKAAKA